MGQRQSKPASQNYDSKILQEIAEKEGPVALAKYLEKNINKWKQENVLFAITGRSATGKSTFINKMRDVRPGEPGFARCASGNTTKEPTPYENPLNPKITFYDLPGLGTLKFPKENYIDEMKINQYDYFFIFFEHVISEDDCWLVGELHKLGKPFCFVRSKIDNDIKNAQFDGRKKENVLDEIRSQIENEIGPVEGLDKSRAIFLISSRDTSLGDWAALLNHIEVSISNGKFEAVMYSLPTLTGKVIEKKYEILKRRILFVTAGTATIAAFPLPGVDLLINTGILVAEVNHYISVFDLNKKHINQLEGFDDIELKCRILLRPSVDMAKFIVTSLGKLANLTVAENVLEIVIPVLGSIASATTTGVIAYRFLNKFLDDVKEDAYKVYDFVYEKTSSPQSL